MMQEEWLDIHDYAPILQQKEGEEEQQADEEDNNNNNDDEVWNYKKLTKNHINL